MDEPIFHDADGEVVPYDGSPLTWRVSVYGFIIHNHTLLLHKNQDEKLYDIPGGGVELHENLEEALKREALEEAGAVIKVGKLVHHVADYFYHSDHKQFFKTLQLFYQAELIGDLQSPTDERTEWVGLVPPELVPEYALPKGVLTAWERLHNETSP